MNECYEEWVAEAREISGATKFFYCALGDKITSATAFNISEQTVGHWSEGSKGWLSISQAQPTPSKQEKM